MKNFLAWIKNSITTLFRKGFRFLFRAFFRLFWILFRTSAFVIGAVILTLVLVGLATYWIAGERIERSAWQQQERIGLRLGSKDRHDAKLRRFDIDEKGYLKFNLNQISAHWAAPAPFIPFLEKRGSISRITLLETLEHAAQDDNIKALAVVSSNNATARLGTAGIEDLRKAIEAFRAQGKMAWIYTTDMGGIGAGSGLRSYYLATSFDSISIAPSGSLGFGGIRIEVPFFRNALDKMQITPEFEAREAYKGFPQQWSNSTISEEVEENLKGMADGVARQWSKEVERTRRLDSETVARALASPYINAAAAQLRGLVDRIAYSHEFWDAFQNTLKTSAKQQDDQKTDNATDNATDKATIARTASNAIPLLAYASYHRLGQFLEDEKQGKRTAKKEPRAEETAKDESKQEDEQPAEEMNPDTATEESESEVAEEEPAPSMKKDGSKMARVALLNWRGQIVRELPQGEWEEGQTISARRATRLLRRLAKDEEFDAVVLYIDSPGGDYVASDLIYHEMMRLRQKKPVAVVMGDVAASGGYFIAMAGERVFAQPLTVTGSIGVFAGKVATRDFWQRWGIDWSVVQSGGESTMHSLIDSYTEDDLTALAEALDAIYADFTEKVASARNLDSSRIQALAGGRIWLGEQAVANELADAIGGFTEAKEWIAQRLQRPQESILFLPYPRESWAFRLRRVLKHAVSQQAHTSFEKTLGRTLGRTFGGILGDPLPFDAQRTFVRPVAPLFSRHVHGLGVLSAPHILLMP